MPWLYLAIAIAGEIIGTTALKASDGFTRLGPSVLVVAGYGIAFFMLGDKKNSAPAFRTRG